MLDIVTLQSTSANPTLVSTVYSVLLSFVLSTAIAFVYEKTFCGLSYSRNFVQALILSSVVAATVMQAIGDSLAYGLGMLGALAIIRFRTNLRDPRDIIFMFAALASGISCGVHGYSIAVVGTLTFCAVASLLFISPLGQSTAYDGMLRFNIENKADETKKLEEALKNNCHTFALMTLHDMAQGNRLEYAYHIKMKRSKTNEQLIQALQDITSIQGVRLLLQETTVEI